MPTCRRWGVWGDFDFMATRRGPQRPRQLGERPPIRPLRLQLWPLSGAELRPLSAESRKAAARSPRSLASGFFFFFFFFFFYDLRGGRGAHPPPHAHAPAPAPSASESDFTLVFCLSQAAGRAEGSAEVSMGRGRRRFVEGGLTAAQIKHALIRLLPPA